jgi:raffinose/stachyose/melibiose transport system permease protein
MTALPEGLPVLKAEQPSRRRPRRRRFTPARTMLSLGMGLAAIVWVLPLFFIFLTSVKSPQDLAQQLPWQLPTHWEWNNFTDAGEIGNFWGGALNSAIIAVIKVPIGLFVSSLAAFALARLRFPLQRLLLGVLALGTLIPVQVALGPLFSTELSLNILNTKLGLILPYLAFGISYQIFILYGFFRAVPLELDEAARIDGANTWTLYLRIVLPLARPALAALFILDFVATWNEYPMALALLQTPDQFTVPLNITNFSTQFTSNVGQLNAYILLSVLPVLIVYLAFQRYFVEGAFSGAIKG